MNKVELEKLKEDEGVKYIYIIPSSFYLDEVEYIIIGNISTRTDKNVRYFNVEDWFLRILSGSILCYACSTLPRKYKIKEFLNIYEKPDLLKLRKFLISNISEYEVLQEALWGLQIINEHRINRFDSFRERTIAQRVLNQFLVATEPMYKMSLDGRK